MIQQLIQRYTSVFSDTYENDLYNEKRFYEAISIDLKNVNVEAIIESPFITTRRVKELLPIFTKLKSNRVKIVVNTRNPVDHDIVMKAEAYKGLALLQSIGVQVIFTKDLHRKLVILDRSILWEGSLNILSQNKSREVMRRIISPQQAWQMVRFTRLDTLMN